MKPLLLLLLSSNLLISGPVDNNPTRASKKPGLAHLGRCTGSAYCSACSNCSRCAHCVSGGTCGVCAAPVSYKPTRRATTPSRSSRSRSSSGNPYSAPARTYNSLAEGNVYFVAASTLNLRAKPAADAKILAVLNRNDVITILELTNDKWVQVRFGAGSNEVIGYLSRVYLSSNMTY
ncbi:SH3 domain-containing protein [Solirubrum puertoriconensis]|uniref:SH3 domain-containing protein n=1 Tax=Solirubrum puertoriconensis TaxID=1751427 RepID=UPI00098F97E3